MQQPTFSQPHTGSHSFVPFETKETVEDTCSVKELLDTVSRDMVRMNQAIGRAFSHLKEIQNLQHNKKLEELVYYYNTWRSLGTGVASALEPRANAGDGITQRMDQAVRTRLETEMGNNKQFTDAIEKLAQTLRMSIDQTLSQKQQVERQIHESTRSAAPAA